MESFCEELFKFDKQTTVIIVDWRDGAIIPYDQAVGNARLVGEYLI